MLFRLMRSIRDTYQICVRNQHVKETQIINCLLEEAGKCRTSAGVNCRATCGSDHSVVVFTMAASGACIVLLCQDFSA
ncbi:hypothetical protein BT69DRAFT_1285660 [Atractiella rhizophila]|nr:hypothetical protein BT69DRAFT_1285660 [Atractiella rhizophila]